MTEVGHAASAAQLARVDGARGALPDRLLPLVEAARNYAAASRSPTTVAAYRRDWSHFSDWCQEVGVSPLPAEPETVALYLTHLADTGRKPATIARRLAAIGEAHRTAGEKAPLDHPVVREVHKGLRRTHGTAQQAKDPLTIRQLEQVLFKLPVDTVAGIRDRALLLVGFFGALRRSELVGLDVEDLDFVSEGLVLTLRRSKTDQEGVGRRVAIPSTFGVLDAVSAVHRWIEVANIRSGPLFRPVTRHGTVRDRRLSDQSVNLIVKHAAERAGLTGDYAGHSLRAGFATSAAEAGASERSIMAQTGHRSTAMVRRYVRHGSLFTDNAASALLPPNPLHSDAVAAATVSGRIAERRQRRQAAQEERAWFEDLRRNPKAYGQALWQMHVEDVELHEQALEKRRQTEQADSTA